VLTIDLTSAEFPENFSETALADHSRVQFGLKMTHREAVEWNGSELGNGGCSAAGTKINGLSVRFDPDNTAFYVVLFFTLSSRLSLAFLTSRCVLLCHRMHVLSLFRSVFVFFVLFSVSLSGFYRHAGTASALHKCSFCICYEHSFLPLSLPLSPSLSPSLPIAPRRMPLSPYRTRFA